MGLITDFFNSNINPKQKEHEVSEFDDIQSGESHRPVRTVRRHGYEDSWEQFPIPKAIGTWKKKKSMFEAFMKECLLLPSVYPIDEIALVFDNHEDDKLHAFIDDAVQSSGVKLFNVAYDHVETGPIESAYDVAYHFLEVVDLGMRVEVMKIERGVSPLHESHLSPYNPTVFGDVTTPAVVHLSFKIRDDEWEEVVKAIEEKGGQLVQECWSTYGHFAYFRVKHLGQNIYLKPRVNMRDQPPRREKVEEEADRGEFGMPTLGGALRAGGATLDKSGVTLADGTHFPSKES